jgi:hypothetical protein
MATAREDGSRCCTEGRGRHFRCSWSLSGDGQTLSTVVSTLMHNPELARVMEKAATGDANAVNAFTTSLISGVDSGFNSPQAESQPPAPTYRFQEFFKK